MIVIINGQREINDGLNEDINHNQIGCLPEGGVIFGCRIFHDYTFNEIPKLIKELIIQTRQEVIIKGFDNMFSGYCGFGLVLSAS